MGELTDLELIKIYAEEGVKIWERMEPSDYGRGMIDAYKNILKQTARMEADKQKGNEVQA